MAIIIIAQYDVLPPEHHRCHKLTLQMPLINSSVIVLQLSFHGIRKIFPTTLQGMQQ